jgi:hypothetical protein
MRVGLGSIKDDNAAMRKIGKRGRGNSSDRRLALFGASTKFVISSGYGFDVL